MKVAVASDTQGVLPEIAGPHDLFIHCGNFCPTISGDHVSIQSQISWLHERFRPWLDSINATHKIIIPGHGDIAVGYLEPNFEFHVDAIYLRDQSTTVNGLVVYGMPWVPYALRKYVPPKSSFISRNSAMYEGAVNKIPDNVNLLITRIPPYGMLDKLGDSNVGDKSLLSKISKCTQLKMHFFGFAVNSGGEFLYQDKQLFANGCLGQSGYIEIDTVD